jgi:hypothetical protein
MGNALEFVSNGGTTPTILLSSTGTTRPSFTLNNNLILTNNTRLSQGSASVAAALGGVISGSGNLNKGGTGSVTLSNNASTYSGATVIESGTFVINKVGTIGNSSSLGSGGNITLGTTSGSGVLQWNGSNETTDKTITLGGSTGNGTLTANTSGQTLTITGNVLGGSSTSNRSLFVNGAGNVALSGTISNGSGASGGVITVTKSAAGTLTLAGNNSYSGGTNLNAGTVVLAHAAGFGTGAVTLNGGTLSNNANLTFNNDVVLTTGSVNTANSTTLTSAGAVSGVANLAKSGTGILALTNGNSSFSGGVWVQAGSIYSTGLGNASATSTLGTNGTIKLGSSATAGTLRYVGAGNETSNKVIDLAGTTGGGTITANQSVLTLTSNLAMSGAGAKTLTLASSSGTAGINFNGLLADVNGVLSLRVNGSGIGFFALGNNNNSFTGSVTVDGNIVEKATRLSVSAIGNSGANSALGQNGTINLGSTGAGSQNTLVYTGSGETTNKVINLAGTVGNAGLDQSGTGLFKFTNNLSATGAGAKTFTLEGSTSGTGEFAGQIIDSSGGATSLAKSGNGTWMLSGSNTYTGGTSVNAGKLLVNNTAGSGTGTGSVTVAASALLGGNGTISGVTTIGAGAFLSPGNSPGVLTFADNLILASTSTTTMEISGTDRGTSYDGITMSGSSAKSLTFGGTLNLIFGTAVSDTVTAGVYDLFALGNVGQSGAFSSVSISGTALNVVTPTAATGLVFAGSNWTASMTDAAAANWNLSFDSTTGDLTIAAIPEPSSLSLGFGAAAFGYIALYRRRKAR